MAVTNILGVLSSYFQYFTDDQTIRIVQFVKGNEADIDSSDWLKLVAMFERLTSSSTDIEKEYCIEAVRIVFIEQAILFTVEGYKGEDLTLGFLLKSTDDWTGLNMGVREEISGDVLASGELGGPYSPLDPVQTVTMLSVGVSPALTVGKIYKCVAFLYDTGSTETDNVISPFFLILNTLVDG